MKLSPYMIPTIVFLFIFGYCSDVSSQAYGYEFIKKKKKRIKIKFKRHNNLIILPVRLNDTFNLNFILDTGVRHTLLTKRLYTDSLNIKYGRKFTLYGADKRSTLVAFIASNLKLELPGLIGSRKTLLVLEKDYFELDNSIGIPIHGILGTDLFLRYTIKINYANQYLVLYEPEYFKPKHSYRTFPIELFQDKPYLETTVILKNGMAFFESYLIDTGASLSLLLDLGTDKRVTLPQRYIKGNFGQILGGDLNTYVGRIQFLGIGHYVFKDVITNFQEPLLEIDTSHSKGLGLIGGGILGRFDVIFDFLRKKMYLRPNRNHSKPFSHDRSGLLVKIKQENSELLEIINVVDLSPADLSGIKKGDIIVQCNSRKQNKLTLDYINTVLQGEVNSVIQLKILRNGELMKFNFKLKDLI